MRSLIVLTHETVACSYALSVTQSDTATQNVLNAVSLIVLFVILLLLYLYKEKVLVLGEEKQAMLLWQLLLIEERR